MMISQAIQAFGQFSLLQAVFGNMSTFVAAEAFHHVPLFLAFLIGKGLEVAHWSALLLLLFLLLFSLGLLLPFLVLPFLFLQSLLILLGLFLLLLLFFLGLTCTLFLCYFFESLLQKKVADVLGGLVALDAVAEERPCVCVCHGIFLGILLYCQFLLLHLQDGDYFYLLKPVNIEDIVFPGRLLDQRRRRVASVIGFVVGGWLFFGGGNLDGFDGHLLSALLLLGLFGLFGLDVGLGARHSQRVDITRWYKTIMDD